MDVEQSFALQVLSDYLAEHEDLCRRLTGLDMGLQGCCHEHVDERRDAACLELGAGIGVRPQAIVSTATAFVGLYWRYTQNLGKRRNQKAAQSETGVTKKPFASLR